jgi:uncharacterized protein (DUF1330 family)
MGVGAGGRSATAITRFLVLFFKKERLAFLLLTGRTNAVQRALFPGPRVTIPSNNERCVMAAYIVATVRITQPDRFAAYGKAIAGLSESFGGTSVVRGAVAEVLEGQSPVGERVVVTRFEDAQAARNYVTSAQYVAAKAMRAGAAEVEIRLLID